MGPFEVSPDADELSGSRLINTAVDFGAIFNIDYGQPLFMISDHTPLKRAVIR